MTNLTDKDLAEIRAGVAKALRKGHRHEMLLDMERLLAHIDRQAAEIADLRMRIKMDQLAAAPEPMPEGRRETVEIPGAKINKVVGHD